MGSPTALVVAGTFDTPVGATTMTLSALEALQLEATPTESPTALPVESTWATGGNGNGNFNGNFNTGNNNGNFNGNGNFGGGFNGNNNGYNNGSPRRTLPAIDTRQELPCKE